jgi:hypothetical protein
LLFEKRFERGKTSGGQDVRKKWIGISIVEGIFTYYDINIACCKLHVKIALADNYQTYGLCVEKRIELSDSKDLAIRHIQII